MHGFTEEQVNQLVDFKKDLDSRYTFTTDQYQYGKAEYWEDYDRIMEVVEKDAPLVADCEGYAMAVMHMAMRAGYKARLVLCLTEKNQGHCICEVVSDDMTQAYYFDNRLIVLVHREQLMDYKFHKVSPWNPVRADPRPWQTVISEDRRI